ncbi:MAG: alanine--tRNA ligase [Clostridia bacterium]|nr:alanine--tRNA ligase [Clostridia bacterium]
MKYMGVNEIREKFLSFFESKGCLRLNSFSLVPKNDASLLLINSGMAPMKKWFTLAEEPPRRRVTTCQKCIRTPDIERVGKTARHGTFFEMLGNFSFGDYFKHEATAWAWEFFTKVMEIPEDRLWVSVYEEDDDARDIWINEVGVDPTHIVKLGKEDNFWEHGTGPCGPCSEIYFDRGEKYGCNSPDCGVGCDCDRFMEVWNLVFTQFDKDEEGNYNPLANPNIDTGMGLERLAVVMQGVDNLFEVDTVQDVIKHASKIAGVEYKADEKTDISLRVIADHIRSTVMMVSDGVIPSNEGRGYVLRRLLRRAARHGKLLNIDREFLGELAQTVIDASKSAYPELEEKREYITMIIKKEEERFHATIDNGLVVLNKYIDEAKASNAKEIAGDAAFKLHDTYGFPLDLTVEMAAEQGLGVDTDGFEKAMNEQKLTAKNSRKDGSSWEDNTEFDFRNIPATEFVGYDKLSCESEILAVTTGENGKIYIVSDKTPFYAEMGGQSGDIGRITQGESTADVTNTTKTGDGVYVHEAELVSGVIKEGKAELTVDTVNRMSVSRNHSATHLLHKALKGILGSHVAQAGSMVSDTHLRFDFSHFEAMTKEQLKEAEKKVNNAILACMPITVRELPIDEAKTLGAEAQFGEKYGDVVRVVSMGDYSVEFCGGTHLKNTSECGLFKITSESGVAAGVRRIEAVTGAGVLNLINTYETILADSAAALKTNRVMELVDKAVAVMAEHREYEKKLAELGEKMAAMRTKSMLAGVKHLGEVNLLTAFVDEISVDELKTMADSAKAQMINGVVVFATNNGGKITFVAMAMPEAVAKGVHCGKIIKEVTAICGGKGGGKPDMAQGGGSDAMKIDDALASVDELILNQIG